MIKKEISIIDVRQYNRWTLLKFKESLYIFGVRIYTAIYEEVARG